MHTCPLNRAAARESNSASTAGRTKSRARELGPVRRALFVQKSLFENKFGEDQPHILRSLWPQHVDYSSSSGGASLRSPVSVSPS